MNVVASETVDRAAAHSEVAAMSDTLGPLAAALLGFVRDEQSRISVETGILRQTASAVPALAPDRADQLHAIEVGAAYLAGQRSMLHRLAETMMATVVEPPTVPPEQG